MPPSRKSSTKGTRKKVPNYMGFGQTFTHLNPDELTAGRTYYITLRPKNRANFNNIKATRKARKLIGVFTGVTAREEGHGDILFVQFKDVKPLGTPLYIPFNHDTQRYLHMNRSSIGRRAGKNGTGTLTLPGHQTLTNFALRTNPLFFDTARYIFSTGPTANFAKEARLIAESRLLPANINIGKYL